MAERIRTNAEIDLLNQFVKEGETPLPYEVADNNSTENQEGANQENADAEKIKAEADAAQKIIDVAAEVEKDKNADTSKEKTAPIEVELDDEKVLAYLKSKKGKEATSLDDLLNPKKELSEEEKKSLAEQRDANKIAYGLSQGLFSKKELETFITDTKNPTDLVYASYVADQKAKDHTLTDDEIEEEFNEKFGINEKVDSRQYKAGQTLINNIANNLIREKHSKILNLDNAFDSHENSQATQKEIENKILSQAPIYKKAVDEIKAEIKKVSFQISKDESWETELDDEVVDEIASGMLDQKYVENQIKNGWSKDAIKQIAQTTGILKQIPKMLKAYADKQVLANQAGNRGVLPQGKQAARQQAAELTDKQKEGLAYIDSLLPQAQVAN